VAVAHDRSLEVMVWVLKKADLDHTQTWNTLARRGVDLFTSDLPPDAAEWYQQELRSRAMGYSGYAAEKLEANYGVWPSPETLAHVTKSVYDLKNICN